MLLPESRDVQPGDLIDLYGWPRDRWVRACVVQSLDGSFAGPDGLSGSISSPTDRAVLAAVRARADAYLVGAGTLRSEGYGPVRARPDLAERRLAAGQAPAPTLVAVSARCRFDWSSTRFTDSDNRPIVLTTESAADSDVAAAQAAGCEVVTLGRERVDLAAALAELTTRGLTRITLEGGPSLLRQAAGSGLVDEVDLTVSPVLVGGGPGSGGPAVSVVGLDLRQVLEQDGFLFTRYVRAGER